MQHSIIRALVASVTLSFLCVNDVCAESLLRTNNCGNKPLGLVTQQVPNYGFNGSNIYFGFNVGGVGGANQGANITFIPNPPEVTDETLASFVVMSPQKQIPNIEVRFCFANRDTNELVTEKVPSSRFSRRSLSSNYPSYELSIAANQFDSPVIKAHKNLVLTKIQIVFSNIQATTFYLGRTKVKDKDVILLGTQPDNCAEIEACPRASLRGAANLREVLRSRLGRGNR